MSVPASSSPTTKQENEETLEAFIIVMGMSFLPVLFAFIGLVLIDRRWIYIPDYHEDGKGVRALGQGFKVVVWFAAAGFLLPCLYSLRVLWKNQVRNRAARKLGQTDSV